MTRSQTRHRPNLSPLLCGRLTNRCVTNATNQLPGRLLWGVLLVVSLVHSVAGVEPTPVVREIFVPYENLDVLIEAQPQRVFLSREEYDELIRRSQHTPHETPPHNVLLVAADYEAVIADGRAFITGSLEFEVLAAGWQIQPLELEGVGIRQAQLGEGAASLAEQVPGQQSGPFLFLPGKGRHTLRLSLVAPLETTAAQQRLAIRLPTPPATQFELRVPGNVELRSGAAVLSRQVDKEVDETRFQLVPSRGPMELILSLNNRYLREQSVIAARSVIVDEVTQAYERLHATFSLDVLHGAVEHLRFAVPREFEITTIDSPLLSRWAVHSEQQQSVLEVELREATVEPIVLNILATRNSGASGDWTMPRLDPIGVNSHVSILGLLLEDRLRTESLTAVGLIPIDTEVLRGALPATVFRSEPGTPQIRPISAHYAPQSSFELRARFEKPAAQPVVDLFALLTIDETMHHLRSQVNVTAKVEKQFEVDVAMDAEWEVKTVLTNDGQSLLFDRLPAEGELPDRIHILLPKGVSPGHTIRFHFEATRSPPDWLTDWSEQEIAFPQLRVLGSASQRGAVAVQSSQDLRVRPNTLQGLIALEDRRKPEFGLEASPTSLAFRYDTSDYAATMTVIRKQPSITARVFSFLRLEAEGLFAHYELLFEIDNAGARELTFRLPGSTPSDVAIQGLDGVQVKQYQSEEDGDERRWTVRLAERRRGQVRLAVDFQQQVTEELAGFALPLASGDGVDYQTAIVAVEGKVDFDTTLQTDGRRVDVGELVDADYQVGRRLVGVFGLEDGAGEVRVDVSRRPGYGMPAAIVQRCELVTIVSINGISQTAARYRLRTKASNLEVRLPLDAELWSATVDGTPAAPQRDGASLLLNLPTVPDRQIRDLQIVFQTPNPTSAVLSKVEAAAPTLLVRDSSEGDERFRVPMADVEWHLILPEGRRVVSTQGTVFRDAQRAQTSPLVRLGAVIYKLAGGIGSPFMLSAVRKTAPTGRVTSYGESSLELLSNLAQVKGQKDVAAAPKEKESLAQTDGAVPADAAVTDEAIDRFSIVDADGGARVREYWALEGVRSLPIGLDRTGEQVTFRSMGVAPRIRATLLDRARVDFASWALAFLVFGVGVCISSRRRSVKVAYVISAMALSLLLPLLIGSFTEADFGGAFERSFYAASLLVPWYFLSMLLNGLSRLTQRATTACGPATAVLLLGLMLSPSVGTAQVTVTNLDGILSLVNPPPVRLPEDAVIIPYDATDEHGIAEADKVLVPYEKYLQLWSLAYPDEAAQQQQPPALFATAGAQYRTTLTESEELVLEGKLAIDVFVDGDVEIALPLQGAVLTKALMDGEPAKIRVVAPNNKPATQPPNQQVGAVNQPESLLVMYASGRGRKQFEFTLRLRLRRSGGWRLAAGRLPTAAATQLSILTPAAGTELHLRGVNDRTTFESQRDNETIETALRDGHFRLQWRPVVSVGQVDQTLTAVSAAVLDVQEDALRLTWMSDFALRQSQRESFTLIVPSDYLIEGVSGDNVRGWRNVTEENQQRIEVTLLRPATKAERLSVRLSRPITIGSEPTTIDVPKVSVPDAVQHRGLLLVRRSPLTDLQAEQVTGLSRADTDDPAAQEVLASAVADSPLGIRPHQAFRFSSEAFSLQLSTRTYDDLPDVEIQALLKLADADAVFEAKLNLECKRRSVYRTDAVLPAAFELAEVIAPGEFEWSVVNRGPQRILTVFYKNGRQGQFSLLIKGRLIGDQSATTTVVPSLEVLNVAAQSGHIVVQVDPALDVQAEQLNGCELVLLERVRSWVDADQMQLARLAIHYRTPSYSAVIRTTPRQPQVSHLTITNVRVTTREVETTLFIRFNVLEAGIREVVFRVPAWMSDARITVPQLRQRTVEPVADDPDMVRIRLELQDEVTGQLIVVVERDRAIASESLETVLPIVETGRTDERFVVLENVGRDEIVVEATAGISELKRQQSEWRELANVLGSAITQAFIIRDAAATPRFTLSTRQRATVQTADARIRLAETLLLFDANGAFRARQTYRIDNKTEQYLQLQLPADSVLWTASVAGQPVKPATVAGTAAGQQVRIPLIKTAPGDLDYEVQVKYGGQLKPIGNWNRFTFPLIRTVNINVEESQVRLRLPETHRWFDFTGSMQRVASRGDLAAGFLSYQTRQIESLRRVLASGETDDFTKVRAATNLKKAVDAAVSFENFVVNEYRENNDVLQQELVSNSLARQDAQLQIAGSKQEIGQAIKTYNRRILREMSESQETRNSRNVVIQLGDNFDHRLDVKAIEGDDRVQFDRNWFKGHQLSNDVVKGLAENKRLAPATVLPESQREIRAGGMQLAEPSPSFAGGRGGQQQLQGVDEVHSRDGDLSGQLYRYQQRLEASDKKDALTPGDSPFARPDVSAMSMMGIEVDTEESEAVTGFATAVPVIGEDLGLSSLDVAFAERGDEYFFTTPRGEIAIAARALRATHVDRVYQLLLLLAVVAGGLVSWRTLSWLNRSLSTRVRGVALVLAGCISLTGIFPVLGGLSLAAGIRLFYKSYAS